MKRDKKKTKTKNNLRPDGKIFSYMDFVRSIHRLTLEGEKKKPD
jgi:hypothetical protein